MNYKEHFIFALITCTPLIILELTNPLTVIKLVITIFVFSTLPDIDHSKSKPSKILQAALLTGFMYYGTDFLTGRAFGSLAKSFALLGALFLHWNYAADSYKHRRFPHTYTFGALAGIALYFLTNSITITAAGSVSFLTHIITDGYFVKAYKNDKKLWRRII